MNIFKQKNSIKKLLVFLLCTLLTIPNVFINPSKIHASNLSHLEQQINIINGEFFTTNATDSPTDNSLGLIHFDSSDYTGATVYFEAVIRCQSCSGGNNRVTADLYDDGGASQTSVVTSNNNYTRVRSNSLSLSTDDFTARFKLDATSGTAYIKAARLVIVQSATQITDTQTQIEAGNFENTNNTSATSLTAPKYYSYTDTRFSGTHTAYFEATIKASGTSTAYAELYNRTDGSTVTESTVSTTTTSGYVRVRSTQLSTNWDTSNSDEYEVRIRTSGGADTAYLSNAKIIIDQTQAGGIGKVEVTHDFVTSERTQTNTSYTQESFLNQFNPTSFDGTNSLNIYLEAVIKTTGSTAYAALYDATGTNIIDDPTNSEIASTATSYTRTRTSNLASNADWPASATNLDTILKASNSNTTSVSLSRLIIQAATVDPSFTFTLEGVASSTATNGVSTTVTTTISTVPFGIVGVNTPVYAAHKLSIVSNDANSRYTVEVRLANQLQGQYPGNNIDPFIGSSASWNSPQTWSSPSGNTLNVNTGWIGANTSDTDVNGWTSGSGKFGPLDTAGIEIMRNNSGADEANIYVTYALEVNVNQPADTYAGQLIYSVLPVY